MHGIQCGRSTASKRSKSGTHGAPSPMKELWPDCSTFTFVDIGGSAAFHHIEQRDDRRRRKIDMSLRCAGLIEHLAERQGDPFELGQPAEATQAVGFLWDRGRLASK